MGAGERTSWNALARQVPGIVEIPRAESPAVGEFVAEMETQGLAREQLLGLIQTVAAAPAKRAIERAWREDSFRRDAAARDLVPRYALVRAIVGLLSVVVGIVLVFPDSLRPLFSPDGPSLTSARYYEFDLDEVAVVAGVLMLAGAIVHYRLERHRPRALHYPPRIYIPYALVGVFVSWLSIARLVESWPAGVSATLGVAMCAAATLGFIALFWYSRRTPSAAQALAVGSGMSRDFDRRLRDEVRAVIQGSEHVNLDSYRAQALEGVRRLYERGAVGEDDALWMLREIAPEPAVGRSAGADPGRD